MSIRLSTGIFTLGFFCIVLLITTSECSRLSSLSRSNQTGLAASTQKSNPIPKSRTVSTAVPCGSYNKILNDPRVQAAMKQFWNNGYVDSSINARKEITALVNKRSKGGYSVDIIPPIYADANSWYGHISILIKQWLLYIFIQCITA